MRLSMNCSSHVNDSLKGSFHYSMFARVLPFHNVCKGPSSLLCLDILRYVDQLLSFRIVFTGIDHYAISCGECKKCLPFLVQWA